MLGAKLQKKNENNRNTGRYFSVEILNKVNDGNFLGTIFLLFGEK
jgi:hypothetical protein